LAVAEQSIEWNICIHLAFVKLQSVATVLEHAEAKTGTKNQASFIYTPKYREAKSIHAKRRLDIDAKLRGWPTLKDTEV